MSSVILFATQTQRVNDVVRSELLIRSRFMGKFNEYKSCKQDWIIYELIWTYLDGLRPLISKVSEMKYNLDFNVQLVLLLAYNSSILLLAILHWIYFGSFPRRPFSRFLSTFSNTQSWKLFLPEISNEKTLSKPPRTKLRFQILFQSFTLQNPLNLFSFNSFPHAPGLQSYRLRKIIRGKSF